MWWELEWHKCPMAAATNEFMVVNLNKTRTNLSMESRQANLVSFFEAVTIALRGDSSGKH